MRAMMTFLGVCAFFLPTAIMLIMPILMFVVSHKRQIMLQNGGLGQSSSDHNQQSAFRKDMKAIRMLLPVVGVCGLLGSLHHLVAAY